MIEWDKMNRADTLIIRDIVRRAERMGLAGRDRMALSMDLEACHISGCPLRLADLLAAQDFDFAHDIAGIHRHIDRETGALRDCFVPRYAIPAGLTMTM